MDASPKSSGFNFYLNKALWNKWGHESAVPFRVLNLLTLIEQFGERGHKAWLFGRTLRSGLEGGFLEEDHDDDLLLDVSELDLARETIYCLAEEAGFEVIRDLPNLISVSRYERYVDIHPNVEGYQPGSPLRVHGRDFPTFAESHEYVDKKYSRGDRPVGTRRNPRRLARDLRKSVANRVIAIAKNIEKPGRRSEPRTARLTKEEFLDLQFDPPGSLNWSWRGRHFSKVSQEGWTIRQSIEALEGRLDEVEQTVTETNLLTCCPEPINLSRKFWQTGDNFFFFPLIFGFRHSVLPYHAANLWISHGLLPMLYSREYYAQLPPMREEEIQTFLQDNPVEIRAGALVSGRHRAAAMMGRLLKGETYIPLVARILD